MLYLVIAVLAIKAAIEAAPYLRPNTRLREVERFWTAQRLTTAWAADGRPGPS